MIVSDSPAERFKSFCQHTLLFGQEPSLELLAILLVYFVQGILGLSQLAVSFFLKDELGLSPAQVSLLIGLTTLPWVLKPLYGFLSDTIPIGGYRRRSYLFLAGLLGSMAWLYMALFAQTAVQATLAICAASLAIAISDVIADSVVVQRIQSTTKATAGELQSLCWSATALGGLLTAYLSGILLETWSQRAVFAITASFPLLVALAALLIHEVKQVRPIDFSRTKTQLKSLKSALTTKAIGLPIAFVFLWQATPSSDAAFFFFTTNDLGFNPEFLGRVRLVTSLASLLGIWVFQRFLKEVGLRTIFLWSTVLSTGLGMTTLLLVTHANRQIGIGDRWFSLGDSLVLTVMGQIAFMPVLVLAARLCPKGIEATMFAMLMALFNLAGVLSRHGGALLMHGLGITDTDFHNLWILVLITNLSTLLPLPLLPWLPTEAEPLFLSERSPLDPASPQAHSTDTKLVPEPIVQP